MVDSNRSFACIEVEGEGYVRVFQMDGKRTPLFILNTNNSLRYSAYRLISKDLSVVFESLQQLNTLKYNTVIAQSLSFYAVVTYAKCFTKADGRGVKLEHSALKYAQPLEREYHEKLMSMRHNYIAHGGKSDFERNPVCVALHPEHPTQVLKVYDNLVMVTSVESQADIFLSLVINVNKYVEEKMAIYNNKMLKDLNSLKYSDYEHLIFTPLEDEICVIKATGVPED